MARWPSGLRRWNQVQIYPVRKGVGSNPTLVNLLFCIISILCFFVFIVHCNVSNCPVHHLESNVTFFCSPTLVTISTKPGHAVYRTVHLHNDTNEVILPYTVLLPLHISQQRIHSACSTFYSGRWLRNRSLLFPLCFLCLPAFGEACG